MKSQIINAVVNEARQVIVNTDTRNEFGIHKVVIKARGTTLSLG